MVAAGLRPRSPLFSIHHPFRVCSQVGVVFLLCTLCYLQGVDLISVPIASQLGATRNKTKLYVGDRVAAGERHGTVMFHGTVSFAKEGQLVVGLALDIKRSNSQNDGKVEGTRYFRCKPGHALFVDEDDVQLLTPPGGHDLGQYLGSRLPASTPTS